METAAGTTVVQRHTTPERPRQTDRRRPNDSSKEATEPHPEAEKPARQTNPQRAKTPLDLPEGTSVSADSAIIHSVTRSFEDGDEPGGGVVEKVKELEDALENGSLAEGLPDPGDGSDAVAKALEELGQPR